MLTLGAEKYALQRLEALAHSKGNTGKSVPAGRAIAWSGGSEPGSQLNRDVVNAMDEVGIDISQEFPKPWTDEFLGAADVVVTMGCGGACPLAPGKRYEDWDLEDPTGRSLEQIRDIREVVKGRVEALLDEILPLPQP